MGKSYCVKNERMIAVGKWSDGLRRVAALAAWAVLGVCLFAGVSGAEEKLSAIGQLKDQKLAAQRGTVGQSLAEDLLGEGHKELLTTYEKYVDAIAALQQGKVRAVIMDEAPAQRFLKSMENLTVMQEPLSEESYAIGFKKWKGDDDGSTE